MAIVSITTTVFERNMAAYNGGAIEVGKDSMVYIQAALFKGNRAGEAIGVADDDDSILYERQCPHVSSFRVSDLNGGAISIQRGASVNISTTIFEANGANQGAAIGMIDGASLVIIASFFEDNVAAEGADHIFSSGGFSSYSRDGEMVVGEIFLYNVTFTPFFAATTRSMYGLPVVDCEMKPCRIGEACSYSQYSLLCEPCAGNTTVGDGTGPCSPCPAGMGPSADKSECIDCDNTTFSDYGVCKSCPRGESPNNKRTGCVPCPEGQTSIGGLCTCSVGHYDAGRFSSGLAGELYCKACPPGGFCPGGKLASVFASKDRWMDETRQGTPIVYACFSDHCSTADGSKACVAGQGSNCCSEGRHGLLCESCSVGYSKQNNRCILCSGTEWISILFKIIFKALVIAFLCAKLLEKATTRTYTLTTAFSTAVFTLQTVGLAVSDSFSMMLREDAPALATALEYTYSVFTPDRQTPEKCLFPSSLFSNLFVEAVLPPVFATAILAAIALPWHYGSTSCGLRQACDARRALVDKIQASWKGKRLVKKWAGGPILLGTFARVRQLGDRGGGEEQTTRTLSLADCDRDQIWTSYRDIGAAQQADFAELDERQLQRLLRMGDIHTAGRETKPELLRRLRFHVHCDDPLYDNAPMPTQLQPHQLAQAGLLGPFFSFQTLNTLSGV
jgi:predicted outer membrane repeat protein